MTLIKQAHIEVVRGKELAVDDFILYGMHKARILTLQGRASPLNKKYAQIDIGDMSGNNILWIPCYTVFYRILERGCKA